MPTEFKLPELGENVTAGDVVRVLVAAGDTVAKDQPVLELETDKATIEVPSSVGRHRQGRQGQAGREGQGRPGRADASTTAAGATAPKARRRKAGGEAGEAEAAAGRRRRTKAA